MRSSIALFLCLIVAACSAPPPAPAAPVQPAPVPSPAPSPVPALSSDWTDWPLAAGDWVYRQDGRGSIALFGPAGQDAVFMIRCDDAAKQIYLSRNGTAPNDAAMTLRASDGNGRFPARATGDAIPYVAAALVPHDPVLDAIAFSRGRFAVEVSAMPPLAIPNWSEFTRVVEDCRG